MCKDCPSFKLNFNSKHILSIEGPEPEAIIPAAELDMTAESSSGLSAADCIGSNGIGRLTKAQCTLSRRALHVRRRVAGAWAGTVTDSDSHDPPGSGSRAGLLSRGNILYHDYGSGP